MNNTTQDANPEPIKEQVQNEPTQLVNSQAAIPEPPEDKNWAVIREQRKADRKAREEAEKIASEERKRAEALNAALVALTNKPSNNQQQYTQQEESDDDQIKRRVDEIIKQREREFHAKKEEQETIEFPTRLRQNMPDFDKVCHPENLDYLDYHYPELSTPFKHMPEGYAKWEAIYKATKKLVPNLDRKQDQKRMEQNLAKPGSISSTGSTQGSGIMSPTRLTEERKLENWKRMEKDRKGLK